jgi:hypothetical protein
MYVGEYAAFLLNHPGALALMGMNALLSLVAAVSVIRLYRRLGRRQAWAWLAVLPIGSWPLALYAVFTGFATADEAEWLVLPIAAILPTLLATLAFSQWRGDDASRAQ